MTKQNKVFITNVEIEDINGKTVVRFLGNMELDFWKKITKEVSDINSINDILNDNIDKNVKRDTIKTLTRRNPTIKQAWETFNQLYKIETGEDY